MKKTLWRKIAMPGLLALNVLNAPAFADVPASFSHTNVQLTREHLTLDLEILPHMLQQANVLRDLDGDGQMRQAEFDHARTAILKYVQERFGLIVNQRALRTDSVAITYRFHDDAATPMRINLACRYALLLKPEHLRLRNSMFQEFAATHRNYGTITNGVQTVDFEFPAAVTRAAVEFTISGNAIALIDDKPVLFSPAMIWLVAGCVGLLVLGVTAHMRKLARRRARRAKRNPRATGEAASSLPRQHTYELENALS